MLGANFSKEPIHPRFPIATQFPKPARESAGNDKHFQRLTGLISGDAPLRCRATAAPVKINPQNL